MEAHVTGCAHSAKVQRSTWGSERLDTYTGETIADAIVAADTAMGGWFGHREDPYSAAAGFDGCWKVATCKIAPCLKRAMRGLVYDGTAAPSVR